MQRVAPHDSIKGETPSHPGEPIRDICIDGLKLNITEGAAALDVTRSTLSRLINGKANVSLEMAVWQLKSLSCTADYIRFI